MFSNPAYSTLHRARNLMHRKEFHRVIKDIAAHYGAIGFYLPLRETSGSIAQNILYDQPIGDELLVNNTSPFSFDGANSLENWTETQTPPTSYVEDSGGGVRVYTSDGTSVNILQSLPGEIEQSDTLRGFASVPSVTSGQWAMAQAAAASVGPNRSESGKYNFDYITGATPQFGIKRATAVASEFVVDGISCRKIGELDATIIGATPNSMTCLGYPAFYFDGVNDYVQLSPVTRFTDQFDPDEGTFMLAVNGSQSAWESATSTLMLSAGVNSSNFISIYKINTRHIALYAGVGGIAQFANWAAIPTSLYDKWVLFIGTWNRSLNRLRLYAAGAQRNQVAYPTAGAWVGGNLVSSLCRMGAPGGVYWSGGLSNAVWLDKEISVLDALYLQEKFIANEPLAVRIA